MTTSDERAKALWQDLLEKDDRTSPAEYPDMALITFEEFAAGLAAAELRGRIEGLKEAQQIAALSGLGAYELWEPSETGYCMARGDIERSLTARLASLQPEVALREIPTSDAKPLDFP